MIDFGSGDIAPATVRMYEQKAGHLIRLMGEERLPLDRATVVAYVNRRRTEGAHPTTIYKEICTLRKSLKLADVPYDCIPTIKARYVPRTRYLTLDELRALIAQLPEKRQLWVLLAVFTGARSSEVEAICWQHIDWQQRTVFLQGTKTAKSRRLVPLHKVLEDALWPIRQDAGPVVEAWGHHRKQLPEACKRAGIARVSPNDLRRTLASWLKQAGVDSFAVAQILGHSTSRMVELVYGRIDQKTLTKAMAQLPGIGASDCANGVQDRAAAGSFLSELAPARASEVFENTVGEGVLGARIELAARGFSVRCSTK